MEELKPLLYRVVRTPEEVAKGVLEVLEIRYGAMSVCLLNTKDDLQIAGSYASSNRPLAFTNARTSALWRLGNLRDMHARRAAAARGAGAEELSNG
jgi:hypothetical protein